MARHTTHTHTHTWWSPPDLILACSLELRLHARQELQQHAADDAGLHRLPKHDEERHHREPFLDGNRHFGGVRRRGRGCRKVPLRGRAIALPRGVLVARWQFACPSATPGQGPGAGGRWAGAGGRGWCIYGYGTPGGWIVERCGAVARSSSTAACCLCMLVCAVVCGAAQIFIKGGRCGGDAATQLGAMRDHPARAGLLLARSWAVASATRAECAWHAPRGPGGSPVWWLVLCPRKLDSPPSFRFPTVALPEWRGSTRGAAWDGRGG